MSKLLLTILHMLVLCSSCLNIVDLDEIRQEPLRCMNFYGLETQRMGLVCDWQHNFEWYLDRLVENLGINTIRLPFSYELYKYHSLDLMDKFVAACKTRNLKVILDWHRTWNTHQGPTPEEGITKEEFAKTWIDLLTRYPDAYGVGIFNELQGDDTDYAIGLHTYLINQIEKVFPGKFHYFAGCPRWGGDCANMTLENHPAWDRIFIEVHKYVFSGKSDVDDWSKSIPSKVSPKHWFVGEVGWKQDVPKERAWAEMFLTYLNSRNITNLCAWTIAHSGDTEGWWKDDCETFNWEKASLLRSFWNKNLKGIRLFKPCETPLQHRLLRPHEKDKSSKADTCTLELA